MPQFHYVTNADGPRARDEFHVTEDLRDTELVPRGICTLDDYLDPRRPSSPKCSTAVSARKCTGDSVPCTNGTMSSADTRIRSVQLQDCIVHGDCVEVMREMPDCSVGFVLTDPPYLVNRIERNEPRSGVPSCTS